MQCINFLVLNYCHKCDNNAIRVNCMIPKSKIQMNKSWCSRYECSPWDSVNLTPCLLGVVTHSMHGGRRKIQTILGWVLFLPPKYKPWSCMQLQKIRKSNFLAVLINVYLLLINPSATLKRKRLICMHCHTPLVVYSVSTRLGGTQM